MGRAVFRVALILMGLLFTIISIVVVIPYSDRDLRVFMTAPENCGGACLLGVQPGTTRVGEAMVLLRSHEWAGEVRQSASGRGYAQITWEWSGAQPVIVDDNREGRITFYWDDDDASGPELIDTRIETVTIYTHFRIYSLQAWLGDARSGTADLRPDGMLGYSAAYDIPGGMMNLSIVMPCPADRLTYWDARTRLTMSIGRGSSPFIRPTDVVKMC